MNPDSVSVRVAIFPAKRQDFFLKKTIISWEQNRFYQVLLTHMLFILSLCSVYRLSSPPGFRLGPHTRLPPSSRAYHGRIPAGVSVSGKLLDPVHLPAAMPERWPDSYQWNENPADHQQMAGASVPKVQNSKLLLMLWLLNKPLVVYNKVARLISPGCWMRWLILLYPL